MGHITISLDDDSALRLKELARKRGESVEQTAQALLLSSLPPARPATGLAPDDADGSKALLALAGSLTWPGVEGAVTTTNEEIDRLLAAEAMNPHDNE